MSYTAEGARAELERRKQKQSGYTAEGARAELERRRGTQGISGIGQDIWSGIKQAPGALLEGAKQIPKELEGLGSQLGGAVADVQYNNDWEGAARFPQNIGTGLANLGHGILNTPANINDYLSKKGITPESWRGAIPRQEEHNFGEMLGMKGQKPGDRLIQSAIELAPYLVGGGSLARMVGAGLQAIGQNENPVTAALTVGALETPGLVRKGIKNNPASTANASGKVQKFHENLKSEFDTGYKNLESEASASDVGHVVPEHIKNSKSFSSFVERNAERPKPRMNRALAKDMEYKDIHEGLLPKYQKAFKNYLKDPNFENARAARSDIGKAIRAMEDNKNLTDSGRKGLRAAIRTKEKFDRNIFSALENSENPGLAKELKTLDSEYARNIPALENKNINQYIRTKKIFDNSKGKGKLKPAQDKLLKSLNNDPKFQALYGKEFKGISANQFLPQITKKILGSGLVGGALGSYLF